MKHTPLSFEELKKLRKPLRNVNAERREKLTILDNFALLVTRRIGTMGFFLIIFCWTVSWLVWNMLGPDELRFDPYPAFVLWIFISNMIQIFLMPLIMVGQNLQARHAEAKAQVDFEINSKAEREIEAILQHLENQNNFLVTIIDRLERGK